jgi:hypothetical protein
MELCRKQLFDFDIQVSAVVQIEDFQLEPVHTEDPSIRRPWICSQRCVLSQLHSVCGHIVEIRQKLQIWLGQLPITQGGTSSRLQFSRGISKS